MTSTWVVVQWETPEKHPFKQKFSLEGNPQHRLRRKTPRARETLGVRRSSKGHSDFDSIKNRTLSTMENGRGTLLKEDYEKQVA